MGCVSRIGGFAMAGIALGLASHAFAADLPPAPPAQAPAAYVPAPPPVYNWSGVYIGINGGWGWGNAKWTANTAAGIFSATPNDNGGIVGGTLGVNFQTGAFVFGVEGDWDYSGINTGSSANFCTVTGTCQTGNNWLSTIRGRGGIAVNNLLFYLTAGGVFGNMQTTLGGTSTTRTQAGWTAGVGAEYAFAQNWTAKLEYLYANLGNVGLNGTCGAGLPNCPAGTAFNVSAGLTDNLLRVGVNYKF